LENVQAMFEAAGKDVGAGAVNPRRGQLNWRTMIVSKIRTRLKAERDSIQVDDTG
jgi:hypothetical protein